MLIQSRGLASASVKEFAVMLFRRRERSLSLRLKTLLRLQLKEVFSTDLISRRGVDTTRRGAGLVYALAYLIEIRSCYPSRDIIQISGDI